MAATTRALACRGGYLDQVSVAIDQEMGPAEERCCQADGVAEPQNEHLLASLHATACVNALEGGGSYTAKVPCLGSCR